MCGTDHRHRVALATGHPRSHVNTVSRKPVPCALLGRGIPFLGSRDRDRRACLPCPAWGPVVVVFPSAQMVPFFVDEVRFRAIYAHALRPLLSPASLQTMRRVCRTWWLTGPSVRTGASGAVGTYTGGDPDTARLARAVGL
jgi:hypothetical protein